jgi:hypothetical protein
MIQLRVYTPKKKKPQFPRTWWYWHGRNSSEHGGMAAAVRVLVRQWRRQCWRGCDGTIKKIVSKKRQVSVIHTRKKTPLCYRSNLDSDLVWAMGNKLPDP